jgi:hypothetical protein
VDSLVLKILLFFILFLSNTSLTQASQVKKLSKRMPDLKNTMDQDSFPKYLKPAFVGIPIYVPFLNSGKKEIIPTDTLSKNRNFFRYQADNFFNSKLFSLLLSNGGSAKNMMAVNSTLYFELYANRRIASIRFKQLDVFGPTFQDTNLVAKTWLAKAGNAVHLKTLESKLRKQLLFSVGQNVKPEIMADNEKIIRDLPYIRDVSIILTPSKSYENAVDVLILIKERFEYGFIVDINFPKTEVEVYDDNMFGIGHQLMGKLVHHQIEQPNWGGEFKYSFSDFGGKFINGNIDLINTFRKSGLQINVEKKFISTEIKNAGGITFQRITRDSYFTPYSAIRLDTTVAYRNTEVWFGHSFKNQKENSFWGIPTLSGRFFHQDFFAPYENSQRGMIRNHDFFQTSIGFSRRSLFKNNLVYGYGITEDIPYGRYLELASGLDITKTGKLFYSHVLYSKASILNGGRYINGSLGMGGFLRNSAIEQGIIKFNLNYFSRLIFVNRNPYRNFINIELMSGINRYWDEYLSINRDYGLRDFRSLDVRGTNRLKVNLESVHFLNWDYHGFRFAQYFYGDCAFISNHFSKLLNDNFYTGVGIGLRVHNESLVFRVFEIRLTWFPIVPNDLNILKFKIFTQSKSTFDDFLGRKPQEILYQ